MGGWLKGAVEGSLVSKLGIGHTGFVALEVGGYGRVCEPHAETMGE